MTMADGTKEDLVTAAKQEILAKFQAAVLDNPEFSGIDFSALLRAAREEEDDDFIETLLGTLATDESETTEDMLRRVISESQDEDNKKEHCTNELWKGVAILGVAIVAAASLFAPIDLEFKQLIVGGAVAFGIFISWQ